MTRLWPDGAPIAVTGSPAGSPRHFRWRGQTHRVETVTRRWRVTAEWWRQPVRREYFKLTTESGLLVIIFHDLRHDSWYLQRLYD